MQWNEMEQNRTQINPREWNGREWNQIEPRRVGWDGTEEGTEHNGTEEIRMNHNSMECNGT